MQVPQVSGPLYEEAFSSYKVLRDRGAQGAQSLSNVLRLLAVDSFSAVSGTTAARAAFYLDPADFAAGARTVKYRLVATLITNATAPAADFTIGLYPMSSPSGASGTVAIAAGTVVSGSTITISAPAATSMTVQNSGDFTAPVAGWYGLGNTLSTTSAASSDWILRVILQMRQV